MFRTLVASCPQSASGLTRFVLSAGLHVMLIVAAVVLTRHGAPVAGTRPAQPVMLYTETQRTPRPPAIERQHSPGPTVPRAPPPPPRGELELHPSLSAPTLPAPMLPTVGDLVMGTTSGSNTEPLDSTGLSDQPRTATTVDEPVEILAQSPPGYPSELAEAGISGRVEVTYVVDTLGHAEPGSLRTEMSSHPVFEAAVRASVLASRFKPARATGRAVRQLVRQAFAFRSGRQR